MSGAAPPKPEPPLFDETFRERFEALLRWRRDVRRFRPDPVDPDLLRRILALADLAPSVGNCQPWRFVLVENEALREGVRGEFRRANAEALSLYRGEKAALYARLKLSGLSEAPVQLAVFADPETRQGAGLGRQTMPETLDHSAVAAVHALWLMARAFGLGLGWVSILEPETVTRLLDVPAHWRLIAYLCLGYPEEEHLDPELERYGWQERTGFAARLIVKS